MRFVAIVPARAGSRGLPGKNMRALAGKPLVQHAIEVAQECNCFAEIYVTSDDEAVLLLAAKLGVSAVRRPAALASDTAAMGDVVKDLHGALTQSGRETGEAFALLQPTSPLRTARHVSECTERFSGGKFASAVSICALEDGPQKALVIRNDTLEPLFGWGALQTNRQNLERAYRQNGAIWITRWDAFNARGRFVVAPAMPYIMDQADSVDIDTETDLAAAQAAFAKRASS